MYHSRTVILTCALLASGSVAAAQQPPQPSAEQRQLETLVGSWSYELKGSISGSGVWTVEPVWGGHFYRATETYRPLGRAPFQIAGILGYNPGRQEYTWYRYMSTGFSDLARGWFRGGTWYWVFDEVVQDGRRVRRQLTTTLVRPDHRTLTWQRSIEGGPWEVTGEGTATKSP